MARKSTQRSRKASKAQNKSTEIVQSIPCNLIPSQNRRRERLVSRYSGASFTLATSAGYAWLTIDSTQFAIASPWTALSNLYMFVRPIGVKVTITASRSTGSADNPVVGFVATPDGAAVGTTAMNISTFEAPNVVTKSLPPGIETSYYYDAYVAISAYNTPTNGYVPMRAPRCSINSLPRIYFGDLLLLTPGVTITSTANYVQVKAEYVMEFDTIDNSNIQ
jgi:hypothetical protein